MRDRQRRGPEIDRDDSVAAGDRGALDDVQAHAAGADYDCAASLCDARCISNCAHTCYDRAAQCCQYLERDIGGNRDRAFFGDDREVREAGGAVEMSYVLPARAQPRATRRQAIAISRLQQTVAEHRPPLETRGTNPARWRPTENYVIAGAHAGYTCAYFAHYACAFVPEYERRTRGPVAARRMQIALTDSSGLHFDQHLARARRFEFGILNRERFTLLPQNGGIYAHRKFRLDPFGEGCGDAL